MLRPFNSTINPLKPPDKAKKRLYCAALLASSSVESNLSGPNDMGRSCSSVMTVYLPSLSYINIGVLGYTISSVKDPKTKEHNAPRLGQRDEIARLLTSQNSLMNCLHMPQGLAGGEMSVATAMARKSPALAPWSHQSNQFTQSSWMYVYLCIDLRAASRHCQSRPAPRMFQRDTRHSRRWRR
jgi:hypothetical protein